MTLRARKFLTVDEVLNCHAEFGRLDFNAVKKGMGPNWPSHWDKFKNGGAIFEGQRRKPRRRINGELGGKEK